MKRIAILFTVIALGAAACSSSGEGDLDGDWVLTSGVPIADGGPITLSFEGTQLGGRAACNQYGGFAAIDGNAITIPAPADDPNVATFFVTEMACEMPIMESEAAYLEALPRVDAWAIEGDTLSLSGGGVTLVYDRVPPIDEEALVGTTWVLTSMVDGETVTTVAGDTATLILSDDGSMTGGTGCRELSGKWIVAAGELAFPELSATGECPSVLQTQDGFVISVLESATPLVDGNQLTLTDPSGQVLIYTAG